MMSLARSFLLTFTVLMCGSSLLAQPTSGPRKAERLLAENRTLVIAHRGYSAAAPENTIPAFDLAALAGVDLIELDYHHTRDGVPMVLHDATLDRTTDVARRWGRTNVMIADVTAAQLTELDAGRWFGPGFHGAAVVSLDAALSSIQRHNVTLIERKAGDAATCVGLLRQRQLVNDVVVQSFDWEYLKDFHQQEPSQILGALGPWPSFRGQTLTDEDKILSPRWIDEAARVGARIVVWNRHVTREAIRHAHGRGLKVWVYTINDPSTATELVSLGVDGIITDNPSLIWRTLATRR